MGMIRIDDRREEMFSPCRVPVLLNENSMIVLPKESSKMREKP
jgi:hypothetical protein